MKVRTVLILAALLALAFVATFFIPSGSGPVSTGPSAVPGRNTPTSAAIETPAALRVPAPARPARSRPLISRRASGEGALRGHDWHALAMCESTNNPKALSKSGKYRGLYQFDLRTWRSVGGTGDPAAASRAEQTHRAQLLFAKRGRSPWPECGRHL